jgi:hypothetical protein
MEKLDNLVNKVKIGSLEYLNHIFRYIFEKIPDEVKMQSPFLVKGQQFCPFLIQSLINITARTDIDILVQD